MATPGFGGSGQLLLPLPQHCPSAGQWQPVLLGAGCNVSAAFEGTNSLGILCREN